MRAPSPLLLSYLLTTMACARGSNGEGRDTASIAALPPTDTSAVSLEPASGDTVSPRSVPSSKGASQPPASAQTSRPGTGQPAGPPAPPPSSSGGPATASGADTARGRVAVVGSTPVTQVVLRPAGGRSITLTGPLAEEIGAASGAEVWVRGRRLGERTFEVASYAVRSVDGVAAVTGTLTADGERLVVVGDDGRRYTIASPPASLREHVGARVWVSGDLATGITAYGVLRRRR